MPDAAPSSAPATWPLQLVACTSTPIDSGTRPSYTRPDTISALRSSTSPGSAHLLASDILQLAPHPERKSLQLEHVGHVDCLTLCVALQVSAGQRSNRQGPDARADDRPQPRAFP